MSLPIRRTLSPTPTPTPSPSPIPSLSPLHDRSHQTMGTDSQHPPDPPSTSRYMSPGRLKNSVAWLFVLLSVLYFFYSFHIILRHHHRSDNDCPTPFRLLNLPPNLSSTQKHIIATSNRSSPLIPKSRNRTVSFSDSLIKKSKNVTLPIFPSKNISLHINTINVTSTTPNVNKTTTASNRSSLLSGCEGLKEETQVKHLVFGLGASSNLWEARKEYIKVWWRPGETRGAVWVDREVEESSDRRLLPEIRVSGDTSGFKYTHGIGLRSALRITRVVTEMVRLGMEDVRWFVMGDDDTVFVVDNVVGALGKYDHNQLYYVGSSSESHVQNMIFSYNMAFGGGGFAISYPLAMELSKMQDRCIQRYPGLYGSDDRIHACMTELGIPLTKDLGFHQYDVHGDLLGLLSAHPVAPLLSLHHLDFVDPIFPGTDRVESLRRLFKSVSMDSASIIQQSICYDQRREWSVSVSWGFTVQVTRGIISPRELEMPTRTFVNWYAKADYTAYAINTRPLMKHPCQKPFIFYINHTWTDRNHTFGLYTRHPSPSPFCGWNMDSPDTIDAVLVVKKPDPLRWHKSPRRDNCKVLPSRNSNGMSLWVGSYREGEVTEVD